MQPSTFYNTHGSYIIKALQEKTSFSFSPSLLSNISFLRNLITLYKTAEILLEKMLK